MHRRQELQLGDQVSWKIGVSRDRGWVVEKLTVDMKMGARMYKATPEYPKYLVKSLKSGKEAIRKPETLHKIINMEGDPGSRSKSTSPSGKRVIGVKEKRQELKERTGRHEDEEVGEGERKVAEMAKKSGLEAASDAAATGDNKLGAQSSTAPDTNERGETMHEDAWNLQSESKHTEAADSISPNGQGERVHKEAADINLQDVDEQGERMHKEAADINLQDVDEQGGMHKEAADINLQDVDEQGERMHKEAAAINLQDVGEQGERMHKEAADINLQDVDEQGGMHKEAADINLEDVDEQGERMHKEAADINLQDVDEQGERMHKEDVDTTLKDAKMQEHSQPKETDSMTAPALVANEQEDGKHKEFTNLENAQKQRENAQEEAADTSALSVTNEQGENKHKTAAVMADAKNPNDGKLLQEDDKLKGD